MKCPKCEAKINSLMAYYKCEETNEFGIASDGEACFALIDTTEEYKFKCPECGEVLFTDEGAAESFLIGN